MSFPTPGAYQEALQHPETALRDPLLAAGMPRLNALGLPQPITGAFAAVFPMDTPEGRFGVKCFLTNVPDQQARYAAITKYLATHPLPYFTAFAFQPEGIVVGGAAFPVLKTAWVEGEGLHAFVEKHVGEPEVLARLARAWATMLADLEAAGIAHGDLQHGNVLVQDAGATLKLVDYDAMFVPPLRGKKAAEVGHRNYQHPDRTERDFGPWLDRFPGLVVYTALQALIADPSLWSRYDTGENLLFQAGDFFEPSASPLLQEIKPIGDAVQAACLGEPEQLPPFPELLQAPPPPHRSRARRRRERAQARRSSLENAFAPALVGLLLAVLVLATVGGGQAALGLAGLGTGGGLLLALHRYRRLPLVRRRQRMAQEMAFLETLLEKLRAEAERLAQEREAYRAQTNVHYEARLQEVRDEVLHGKLKYHFLSELDDVEGVTHTAVVRLKSAGLRTAFETTPDRVAAVKDLGEEMRARINQWRSALVAQYEREIPKTLTPAQKRAVDRQVAYRLEQIEKEIGRVEEKRKVQEAEHARVRQRFEALPRLPFHRYLLYLLRLGAMPVSTPRPPRPGPPQPRSPAPLPSAPEEKPWWR